MKLVGNRPRVDSVTRLFLGMQTHAQPPAPCEDRCKKFDFCHDKYKACPDYYNYYDINNHGSRGLEPSRKPYRCLMEVIDCKDNKFVGQSLRSMMREEDNANSNIR